LLLAAAGRDERLVRAGQISTPLIRKDTPQHHLPAIITDILNQILKHPSYASKRYCYKGFLYYFSDMLHALERMHSWLRERGVLLMIVQDTYYKDIYVPTADMLIQLADSVGFKLAGRRDWRVLHHLSRLTLARILGEQCRIERCASL